MSGRITVGLDFGPCSHVATATLVDGRWHFAVDAHDDPAVEDILDALVGRRPVCRDLVAIASALADRGVAPEESIEWAATGAVDPDLREGVRYMKEGQRFEHWIQASRVSRGLARLPDDHPYLTLEEVDDWIGAGWEPFSASLEFASGHRRPEGGPTARSS